jgi:hypothetical protein
VLAVTGADGRTLAAVGYRPPHKPFFLEQYLDDSAETAVSSQYGEAVPRSSLVEIGNLVGEDSHAVFFLMQSLWAHLHRENYRHALLTCTHKIKRRFRHLPLVALAEANQERVAAPEAWGSYYDNEPYVMTGRLCAYDQRFSHKRSAKRLAVHVVHNPEVQQ